MFAKTLLAAGITLLMGAHHAPIDSLQARSPIHIGRHSTTSTPVGLTPAQIKQAYNLPAGGGAGKTIAIVDAYDSPSAASDLNKFSAQFGLPVCNTQNPCFTKHKMSSFTRSDSGWALEMALDVQWAHAIAPQANILLVEARSASGNDLLSAVNYARNQPNVVAVSMSWGGGEFSGESAYDSYFTSNHNVAFYASSGDNGSGVSWPAVSPNVVGVGGTTLTRNTLGNVTSETAWSGSGGGRSVYVNEPSYQSSLVTTSGGKRAVPDVSYDADPATGFAVYDTTAYNRQSGWFQVGGTSAGAPQWAAIHAIGGTAYATTLYGDAASSVKYPADFRDVTTGNNGACGLICQAASGYDYVTGLGSPLTTSF